MSERPAQSPQKRAARRWSTLVAPFSLVLALTIGCRHPPATPYLTPSATSHPKPTAVASSTPTPHPTATSRPPSPTVRPTQRRTATPKPTATPTRSVLPSTPTPLPSEVPGPTIGSFRADVDTADPGDDITLTWQTTGATGAVLYKLMASGQLPADGLPVPPNGSTDYRIPQADRNWVDFLLYIWDDDNRSAYAGVTVLLRCPDAWFFAPDPEDICPYTCPDQ